MFDLCYYLILTDRQIDFYLRGPFRNAHFLDRESILGSEQ